MILQLNPTMPLTTPLGRALAHFLIDNGDEHHLLWVCIQDDTGEIWVWPNTKVRGRDNQTMGRKLNTSSERVKKWEKVNMNDDLVKRLRGWHDMPADAWFTTMETAADRIQKLEAALRSIAANACCDSCREAALVARKALMEKKDG